MNNTMKAIAAFPDEKLVKVIDIPLPGISSPNEVLFKMLNIGICGTDIEICKFTYGGKPPVGSDYLILGHEAVGEVIEVGSAVADLEKGDLVVPSVRRPCGEEACQPCRQGLQNFCQTHNFTERGIHQNHGFMTELAVEARQFLYKIPLELRAYAVLTEPLTIAENGIAQAIAAQSRLPWIVDSNIRNTIGEGKNAVVLGAGPIGILGAMALRARGFAVTVYSRAETPNPKAQLIEEMGIRYVSSREICPRRLASMVGSIDLIYEAAGKVEFVSDVVEVLGINGICVLTGIPEPNNVCLLQSNQLMKNMALKNQLIGMN